MSTNEEKRMKAHTLAAALLAAATSAFAADPIHTTNGAALSGYDPVAYFTEKKATKGKPEIELEWAKVKWRFASEANRDAFRADPTRYAPQFGGYCAWAVSKDYTYRADPEAWSIVDGKLYVNYDAKVKEAWTKDLPNAIERANKNWPAVLTKPAK
jgi:hypothetical protein